jgi:TerC family integral membrane protein
MDVPLWIWAAVVAAIVAALLVDLLVFHRDAHEVSVREAAVTSAIWIAVGVAFGIGVWFVAGPERGGEYFAGYLIEKALAVDNIFVFAVILGAFAVPARLQHRVLFFGVLGALVLRALFIAAGASLLSTFSWIMYVFGTFLVVTAVRLARGKAHESDPTKNILVRGLRRFIPVTSSYEGQRFFVRRDARLWATPMLAVLVVIESSDVVFALDSIPAIFAVTDEAFIVFTSNAFAILGLRALYFLLADAIHRFEHLGLGLAAILLFVGVKMLMIDVVHIPIAASLAVIGSILAIAIGLSLVQTRASDGAEDAERAGRADVDETA